MAAKRKVDWPQVVLVAVVGALGLAAISVLGVTWDKLASIPAAEWTLIVSALAGVVGTVAAALRGRITETAPAPTTTRNVRERPTDPPEGDA